MPLRFNEWNKGQAPNDYLGYAKMHDVDVVDTPGVLKSGKRSQNQGGATITKTPRWIVFDYDNGDVYGFAGAPTLYKSDSGGFTWSLVSDFPTLSTVQPEVTGAAYFKGHVFVAFGDGVYAYKVNTPNAGWSSTTKIMDFDDTLIGSNTFVPMYVGQDDVLYIGAGRYVYSIEEKDSQTLDMSDSVTYTVNGSGSAVLDLPQDSKITCIGALDKYLMIGAEARSLSGTASQAIMYPWDRVSSSFNLPIRIAEKSIHQMVNLANSLYFTAGERGNLYTTNLSQASLVAQLPIDFGDTSVQLSFYPGAIFANNNKLYIGVTSTGMQDIAGIYKYSGGAWQYKSISTGQKSNVGIYAMFGGASNNLYAWEDFNGTNTYGVDYELDNYFTSYTPCAHTDLRYVGTSNQNKTYSVLEIQLGRPLQSGEKIRISWRKDRVSAFTEICELDFATVGAESAHRTKASISNANQVQLQIEITATSTTTPEIREIALYE